MSQSLPFDEVKFDKNVKLEILLKTSDVSNAGYFVESDSSNPDDIKGKTKNFPFNAEYKMSPPDKFIGTMSKLNSIIYTENR